MAALYDGLVVVEIERNGMDHKKPIAITISADNHTWTINFCVNDEGAVAFAHALLDAAGTNNESENDNGNTK